MGDKKIHLTAEQLEEIHFDRATYRVYLALSNDSGVWTGENLGKALKMPAAELKPALTRLVKAKIFKQRGKAGYTCPLATAMVEFPYLHTLPEELRKKVNTRQTEQISLGTPEWFRRAIFRADSQDFLNFYPVMRLNMTTAHAYAITEKTEHSAVFSIESRIVKLMDF